MTKNKQIIHPKPTPLERLQYGYDRDSRRTWRRRALAGMQDEHYGYDGLSQEKQSALGNLNLNQSAIGAVPVNEENWNYDLTSECVLEFAIQRQFLDVESGLMNNGYRYYSPYLGRWTAKDPIGTEGGLNLYGMGENNPLGAVDFLGLDTCCPKGAKKVGNQCCYRIDALGRCIVAVTTPQQPPPGSGQPPVAHGGDPIDLNSPCWNAAIAWMAAYNQPATCCGGVMQIVWKYPFHPHVLEQLGKCGTPGRCENGRWIDPVLSFNCANGDPTPWNFDLTLQYTYSGFGIQGGFTLGDSGFHVFLGPVIGTPDRTIDAYVVRGENTSGWAEPTLSGSYKMGSGQVTPSANTGGAGATNSSGVSFSRPYVW